MRVKLRDRWFPDLRAVEAEEAEESNRVRDSIKELVTRPGYKIEIREWLKGQQKIHRPKPGAVEGMNYSIGISDGLQLVKERLDALEHEARRGDED